MAACSCNGCTRQAVCTTFRRVEAVLLSEEGVLDTKRSNEVYKSLAKICDEYDASEVIG